MLTKKGFESRISNILDATDRDENVAAILEELVNERGEVDGVIRSYAKTYPEEDEIFDFERGDSDLWKTKYEDLKDKYNRRFFRNDESGQTTAIVDTSSATATSNGEEKADSKVEEKVQKEIDDLFVKEENNAETR